MSTALPDDPAPVDPSAVAAAQQEVHDTCLWLLAQGLVVGSAGNVSVRVDPDHVVVSAGGMLYEHLEASDHPLVDLRDGSHIGPRKPTSEMPLHTGLYVAMPELGAIVHTHSKAAAAFAVARRDLPFVCNENLGPAAERVLVTEYAVPSSDGLAVETLKALGRQPGSRACLLANHGVVALGATAEAARVIAAQVEWIADIVWRAEMLGGAHVLPTAIAREVCAAYGIELASEAASATEAARDTGAAGASEASAPGLPAAAAALIERYALEPIPVEGGWYRQTWRSAITDQQGVPAGTSIIALFVAGLADGRSTMHRLTRDEVWTALDGDAFRLVLLHPDGSSSEHLVGSGPEHEVQVVVPAGAWMGGHVLPDGAHGWASVSCAMAPGFTPDCFEAGQRAALLAGWPHRATDITDLTHEHDPGVLPADLDGYRPSLGSTA